MTNVYNIKDNSSYYPGVGFVAMPDKSPDYSTKLPKGLNGRTKMCGFIARPSGHCSNKIIERQRHLNGRTKMCGFVARPVG